MGEEEREGRFGVGRCSFLWNVRESLGQDAVLAET